MSIVAGQNRDSLFATLPQTTLFTDRLTSYDVLIVAELDADKSDLSKYGKGMRWSRLTNKEIAKRLHIGLRTVERSMTSLRNLGFVKSTKIDLDTEHEVHHPVFEDDTYRGYAKVDVEAKTLVAGTFIESDISAGARHAGLLLESIGKGIEWLTISKATIASYFSSSRDRSKPVSLTRVKQWVTELESVGSVIRDSSSIAGANKYRLNKELLPGNKVPMFCLPTVANDLQTVEPVEESATEDDEVELVSGHDFAEYFLYKVSESPEGRASIKKNGFYLQAMAKNLASWLVNGINRVDLRNMIDLFAIGWTHQIPEDKACWKYFFSKREALQGRVSDNSSKMTHEDFDEISTDRSFNDIGFGEERFAGYLAYSN